MRISGRRFRCVGNMLLPLLLFGNYGVATACNVPVFRYALENWHAAPYRLTLLHRSALDEAAQAQIDELPRHAEASAGAFDFRTLDAAAAAAEDEADRALLAAAKDTPLPAIVLQYPLQFGLDKPIWSIAWDADAPAKVADSPLRSDLVRRLAGGETAVWLVLHSGDREKDDAAIAMLMEELTRLEQQLKLPDPALGEVTGEQFEGPPLRIKFSLLSIARDDADEALVAMLLHSEPDLAEFADPLVFPVFGRGRALFPLIGAGITPQNIADYAEFLVGACSCQVKEQNPGFDLLLTADWSSVLRDAGVPTEAVASPRVETPAAPEFVPIPRGATPSTPGKGKATPTSTLTAPSPKMTPAAATNFAPTPAPPKPIASARRAMPWIMGACAVGLIVVAMMVWRRAIAPRPRT